MIVFENNEENWKLYNNGSLELTKNSYDKYLNLWGLDENIYKNVLIIGGGDFQLVSILSCKDTTIDLVDPYVEYYKEFHEYLDIDSSGVNVISSLYSEYISNEEYKHKQYDIVLIDCSESVVEETKEIYCEEFFKSLLDINSSLFKMYIPSEVKEKMLIHISQYFDIISCFTEYIEDWEEEAHVFYFMKRDS